MTKYFPNYVHAMMNHADHFVSINGKHVTYNVNKMDMFGRRRSCSLERYIRNHMHCFPSNRAVVGAEIELWHDPKFEIISGSDIVDAYERRVGGGSCMAGPFNKHKIEFYALNPDGVKMLTVKVQNRSGRALLWTDGQNRWLDRVYGNDPVMKDLIWDYAKNHGIDIRTHNDYPEIDWEEVEYESGKVYEVKMKHKGVFPYLDTMQWVTKVKKKKIWLSNEGAYDGLRLSDTEGNLVEDDCCVTIEDVI
jgi:hypothetical protein